MSYLLAMPQTAMGSATGWDGWDTAYPIFLFFNTTPMGVAWKESTPEGLRLPQYSEGGGAPGSSGNRELQLTCNGTDRRGPLVLLVMLKQVLDLSDNFLLRKTISGQSLRSDLTLA